MNIAWMDSYTGTAWCEAEPFSPHSIIEAEVPAAMAQAKRTLILQAIKNYIVSRGPESLAVHMSLRLYAQRHGFRITFSDKTVSLRRGQREMVLSLDQFVQVPIMMENFALFFETIYPKSLNGVEVLDFSTPGIHRYRKTGAAFHFPSVPEDDVMDAYLHWYSPKAGDVVWDAGAHAGASTYSLAKAVGPTGMVYAFEPDDTNYRYLVENVSSHKLTNVKPVKKALCGKTGQVVFQMDGTMNAGIRDFLTYRDAGNTRVVEGISIEDACAEFGSCPAYIKMDIEGAEVAVVEGAAEFLKKHPIDLAIESYHPVDRELTYMALDRFFPTIGYLVESSDRFGQMFTWAKRPG
jgi:FkbM family methyltransferase